MATSKVSYVGNLRTECVHNASLNKIITDAPIDNNGKGEAFSPTDTVATALASCMLTIMGIKAKDLKIDISDFRADVTKEMAVNPRRISKIKVELFTNKSYTDKEKRILENAAKTCPVFYSLNNDIEKQIIFNW